MATLTVPGRCHFDSDGWLRGPINITHVLTPNHGTGFGNGQGVVFHTEAGFEAGTVATFLNPANQVSAFFSIGRDGAVHQYVPVGKGFYAWSQAGGNRTFRGVETEDRTDPSTPLTAAQVTAFAQIFEACSAFDGFPLQITDSPSGRGLILHSDGGQDWGGHLSCPGHVRAAQRPAIVALAKAIRTGGNPAPQPALKTWVSQGQMTLHDLAAQELHEDVSTVLRVTVENSPGRVFAAGLAAYVNAVFAADTLPCPAGVTWFYPGGEWLTQGQLPLAALAQAHLGVPPAVVLQLTAERGPQGQFAPPAAAYINAVFARSPVKVTPGTKLLYG
jgi:hypothetical protein